MNHVAHPHHETLRMELLFYPPDSSSPSKQVVLFQGSNTCWLLPAPVNCDAPVYAPCLERSWEWPNIDSIYSGSFDDFLDMNPSGTWELRVIDSCETYQGSIPEGTQYITEFIVLPHG